MNPLLLFPLAIFSPLLLAIVMLVPPYAGIAGASYIIYDISAKTNPLADKLFDVFYMIDVYKGLFSHWAHHITETSILNYALPLLVLPLLGTMLSIWLTGKLVRMLMNMFQSGVHH